jgi:S1-C subfamily serine protease
VIDSATGRPPRRIGLWFAGDSSFYRAQFVRASETADLAFVKVDATGEFPTVQGIASGGTTAAGDAVAVIGYPLGTTLARGIKTPSMNIGSVSKVEADKIHIEAYSAEGASGSPAFDPHGNVVGVLFGSPVEAAGRIIFLVPSSVLISELRPDERALVR